MVRLVSPFAVCAVALLVVTPYSLANSYKEEYTVSDYPKIVIRAPRSVGNFFRRMFGRSKPTGFQGTAQAQSGYNAAASSFYPSYSSYPSPNQYPGSYHGNYGGYPGGYGGYGSFPAASYSNAYQAYAYPPNQPQVSSANIPYPSYSQQQQAMGGSGPNGNMDFHAVLDQLVKSAGLAPNGDQEASASSIQTKGDTPVFSFKKLYSFPFYLNTGDNNQQPSDGYNLNIPYMKRHIRRMSSPEYQRQQQLVAAAQAASAYSSPQVSAYGSQGSSYGSQASPYAAQATTYNPQTAAYNQQAYVAQYIQQLLDAQSQSSPYTQSGLSRHSSASAVDRSDLAYEKRQGHHHLHQHRPTPRQQLQYQATVSDRDQEQETQDVAESQYQPSFAYFPKPSERSSQVSPDPPPKRPSERPEGRIAQSEPHQAVQVSSSYSMGHSTNRS